MTYYPWMDDSRVREKGRGAICESEEAEFLDEVFSLLFKFTSTDLP
jgi:hypothetical protein